MESKNNILSNSSIQNLLTLRYDFEQESSINELNWNNFNPQQPISENTILTSLENSINHSIIDDSKTVAIALSGGIDSTLVLSLLKKIYPKLHIHGYSIKFANSIDETIRAGKIAEHFGIEHSIIELENYLEELPKSISITKLPFWDLHWYYVAKNTKKVSEFLASGDGGDELFGGYTFRYQKYLSLVNSHSSVNEKIQSYLQCHERDRVPDQEKLFGKKIPFSWNKIYDKLSCYFDNSLELIDQVFLADYNGKLLYNFSIVNGSINKEFGLKPITPLLSNEIIQIAPHIPNSIKYNTKTNLGKLPLRKILNQLNISHLVSDQKLGFSVNTINLWKNYGHKICKSFLSDSQIVKEGWINNNWITTHIDKENLDVRYVNKFLGLLALEIWYRIFISKDMNSNEKLTI
ncbi:MAG: asparagine synthase [Thaumarchaeota archaeon]|nr:MAG: asparagine synthase [Nitrososphaerota archaeon]